LHERVLYERFKGRAEDRSMQVQGLLVPEVLELSPTDKAWLLDARDALAQEGLALEDFGGNAVAVHGIPAALDRADPRRLVESFLAGDGDRPTTRDAVVERFHSMACRRAVMSGDALTDEEIRALLAEAQELEHPHNCPHGRPTVLTFTASELERFFRRKV
jgi:DNA mismatch repair protein MutL